MINTNLSWFEIYDRLRARIKSGGLRAEAGIDRREVMPDAPENEFGMAVARLVDEGLLRENDDHTLKVAKPRARSRRSASFEEDYTAQGRKPVVRTLSWELLDISETPALGPLSGISEAWLLTTPLRGPAMPKSHSQTSDPCPKRGLRDRRLPSRLPEKGV